MADIGFPEAELNARARSYVDPFVMTPLAYAKALGKDVRDGALFIGRIWAKTVADRDMTALDVARGTALNCAVGNMRVLSLTGDASQAELVATDPEDHAETLELLALTPSEGDQFWEYLRPLAEAKHMRYDWRREGDRIHFTFTQ